MLYIPSCNLYMQVHNGQIVHLDSKSRIDLWERGIVGLPWMMFGRLELCDHWITDVPCGGKHIEDN